MVLTKKHMTNKKLGTALLAATVLLGAGCPSQWGTLTPAENTPSANQPAATTNEPATNVPVNEPVNAPVNGNTPSPVNAPKPTNTNTSKTTNTNSNTSKITTLQPAQEYQKALAAHPNSRFQIDDCHAYPGTLTLKKTVGLMLDNRDAQSHVIGIGTRKFTVGASKYLIVSLTELGKLNVTCDGGGAATLTVVP